MAFILLKNRQAKSVSPEQGAKIWRIMNKEIKGTKRQVVFVSQIDKLYLNTDNAPSSYLKHYKIKPKQEREVARPRLLYADK